MPPPPGGCGMSVVVFGAPDSSVPVKTTTGWSAMTVEPEKSPGMPSDSRLKTSNGPSLTVTSPSLARAG